MTLEAVYSDKAKIPEGLGEHYVESDGKFVLQVSGMKTQADFDAYADALKKRFADAGADFAKKTTTGLTREDVVEVVNTALQKFDPPGGTLKGKGNGKGKASDDGDPEVAARLHDLERNVASLTEANQKLEKERDTALGRSRDTTIRNRLTEAATKSGAAGAGVGNLVTLVSPDFEVAQDGSVVTKLEAGNGVSPNQQPEDYFAAISRDESYRMFWPKSVGAGADAGGGGGGRTGLGKENPWSKAGWNVTAQGNLYRQDKAAAEEMMKAAGVALGAVAPVR
jgi:hypothetical protein